MNYTTHAPHRHRLPPTRKGLTAHRECGGAEYYFTLNFDEEGQPREVFITLAKNGSDLGGFADGVALLWSLALQYGVPMEVVTEKFSGVRFGSFATPECPSLLDSFARTAKELTQVKP